MHLDQFPEYLGDVGKEDQQNDVYTLKCSL